MHWLRDNRIIMMMMSFQRNWNSRMVNTKYKPSQYSPKWIQIQLIRWQNGIVWYSFSSTQTCSFFPTLLVNLVADAWVASQCLTDWEKEPCLHNTSLYSQRVKCSDGTTFSTNPIEKFLMRSFKMEHQWQMTVKMFRTAGSQEVSIQQDATRIRIWIDLQCVLPETWSELGELTQKEDIHHFTDTSKNGSKH